MILKDSHSRRASNKRPLSAQRLSRLFSSGDDATKLILKISVVLGGRAEVSGRQASGYTDSRQLGGVGKALWNLSGTRESHLVSGRGGG
jgi:hypothetical protein